MRVRHRAWHFRVWVGLAVLLPAIVLGALLLRQGGAANMPPIRLAPP